MARNKKEQRAEHSYSDTEDGAYQDTAEEEQHQFHRVRAVFVGTVCLFVALFCLLVLFGAAGTFGDLVYSHLFVTSSGAPALLGWSFAIFIVLLVMSGLYLCFEEQPISYLRLGAGGLLTLLSFAVLFAAGANEHAGGLLGSYLFVVFQDFLGVFSYVLMTLGLLCALYILKIFSPVSIWKWVSSPSPSSHDPDAATSNAEEDEEDEEEEDEEDEDIASDDADLDPDGAYAHEKRGVAGQAKKIQGGGDGSDTPLSPDSTADDSVPYQVPPLSLLNPEKGRGRTTNTNEHVQAIMRTLQNFNIAVSVEEVTVGPTFTRYAVRPAEGIRLSRITGLQPNLELALASHPVRIEAPIPGQSLIGIEVPNTARAVLGLQTLLKSKEFTRLKGSLGLVIGKTINGGIFAKSLEKMPHILVAGTTGSGKSVLIHNFILSLLFTYGPLDLRFIFIDPKRVELTLYKGIPHLFTDPITSPKKALQALSWTVSEMERRYALLEEHRARDIGSYNRITKNNKEHMPYLVVVIDELADLIQSFPREIEGYIVRIAQKSRAVGIHLIISTQRPSVNIITGVVKANIPVRIALQVASSIDSRTILDATGAEHLVGAGDLLYSSSENKKSVRVQSAYVTEKEVKEVVSYLLQHNGVAEHSIDFAQESGGGGTGLLVDDAEDALYPEALDIVMRAQKASTSLLQRKLKIGYSRAARLVDMLEDSGIVGPQVGSKPREILTGGEDITVNDTPADDSVS